MGNTPERVLNRDLWEKLDDIQSDIGKYRIATESRLTHLETSLPIMKKDIEKLQKWDKGIGVLAIVGSAIAGIFGINK